MDGRQADGEKKSFLSFPVLSIVVLACLLRLLPPSAVPRWAGDANAGGGEPRRKEGADMGLVEIL